MSHKRNEALRHVQHSMHHVIAAGEGSDRAPDSCKLCPYYRPDFKFRTCLYAHCPYKKQVNVFRSTPEKWDILYKDAVQFFLVGLELLETLLTFFLPCGKFITYQFSHFIIPSLSGSNYYPAGCKSVLILRQVCSKFAASLMQVGSKHASKCPLRQTLANHRAALVFP